MRKFKSSLLLASLVVLALAVSGCAVGPLVSHEPARTVGEGRDELTVGYGLASYVLKWNHGLAEDWDIGVQWEALSLGLRVKHAFVNAQEHGWSFAVAGGFGTSLGGNHYYGDLMLSHLSSSVEPYGSFRYVHVRTDPVDFRNENTGQVAFTVSSANYSYGQFFLGSRFWITPTVNFSLEISSLASLSSGLVLGDSLIYGAGLGFRF